MTHTYWLNELEQLQTLQLQLQPKIMQTELHLLISEIKNTQINNAKDILEVMQMYNVIDCSDNYSKTSGGLWLLYRDEPALDDNGNIVYFAGQI